MTDPKQSTHSERAKSDRVARLRQRATRMAQDDAKQIVAAGIILGILDLLDDEL